MKSRISFILGTVLFLATGCGSNYSARMIPMAPEDSHRRSPASGSYASTAFGDETTSSECAGQARNIHPFGHVNGPGDFTVCPVKGLNTAIEIHGELADEPQGMLMTGQICVFPAQIYAGDPNRGAPPRVVLKPDLSAFPYLPYSQCVDTAEAKTAPIVLNFLQTNYNAVYITNARDRDAMRRCLVGADSGGIPNEYLCPAFARGQFRP